MRGNSVSSIVVALIIRVRFFSATQFIGSLFQRNSSATSHNAPLWADVVNLHCVSGDSFGHVSDIVRKSLVSVPSNKLVYRRILIRRLSLLNDKSSRHVVSHRQVVPFLIMRSLDHFFIVTVCDKSLPW